MIRKILRRFLRQKYGNEIGYVHIDNMESFLIFRKGQYLGWNFKKLVLHEILEKNIISRYIKEGDLIFDIGANIGQFALFFSNLVGDSGRVVSYEPVKVNYNFLRSNVILNQRYNIEAKNLALSNQKSSNTTIHVDKEFGGRMSSLKKDFLNTNTLKEEQKITVSTLKNEIELYGIPDFVKIDVEGFEHEVLLGLGLMKLDKTIFLIEVRWDTIKSVYSYLNNLEYNVYLITSNGLSKMPVFTQLEFGNILASKINLL